ncbi:membrane protein [Agaricicola taiwanensis]|uniref:Membrane protein n=1 Tax=Agaricicola taiwanensis TaxID=591372 RepID=A0A8J2VS69_9RHOB|nr:OpgC domain-containing protein [Agaricicola taiwanensis]GGE38771.1 membrane protein [Agaricicola taiwanensis]
MRGNVGNRDVRIDFFRGLALLSIFINHIPGNLYDRFTHRNFGFSDAAELFVFLAGFVAALAYFPKFLEGRVLAQSYKSMRRSGQLYLAHIASIVAAIALFAFAAKLYGDASIAGKINIAPILEDPANTILGLATLGHQLGYFNILPMYIVLLAMLPVIMMLARIDLRLALGASFALYLATHLFGLNLPQYPLGGGWFFNPLAWQFLFTIGFTAGALTRSGHGVPYHPVVFYAAVGFLTVAFVWAITGFWVDNANIPNPITLFGFDKTNESLMRLLHVLALVYVFVHSPVGEWCKQIRYDHPIALVGRHSLPIFCTASLLSMASMILREEQGGSFGLDTVLISIGVAIQLGLAQVMEWNRTATVPKPSTVPQTKPAKALPDHARASLKSGKSTAPASLAAVPIRAR